MCITVRAVVVVDSGTDFGQQLPCANWPEAVLIAFEPCTVHDQLVNSLCPHQKIRVKAHWLVLFRSQRDHSLT